MTGLGSEALAGRLRRETKAAHPLTDATRVARAFLAGRLGTKAWVEGLLRLHPVHAALERAIARCTHGLPRAPGYALLAAFHRPELHRASAIEDDLASIGVQLLPPRHAPAALAYAARILRVERESPIVLVAHAYLRFGSDLANSHIAGCVARRALSLPDHATLHYFAHPAIADRPAYLAELTAYVDAIPRAYHDPIAGEARAAALLHRAMLDELFAHLHRTRPLTPIAAARLGAPSLH